MPSTQRKRQILIVAGEASGDNYASLLIRELKKGVEKHPIIAVGGEKSREAGAALIAHYSEISVVGFLEVAGKLPRILSLLREIKSLIKGGEIASIVLIDFPDFNFSVGKCAKKFGIPVIYYIPPQMWAWREGRVSRVERISDKIVVPFPFEVDFFAHHGVKVHYYGHPLVEFLREEGIELKREEKVKKEGASKRLTIGLFPGSRESEVDRLLPVLLDAGNLVRKTHPTVTLILPLAHEGLRLQVESIVSKKNIPVEIVEKKNSAFFSRVDCAIASSGTVTLELALLGVPTVIVYRVAPLTYFMGKLLVKVDRIGLPNIVLGKNIFPELIQNDVTAENIVKALNPFFEDRDLTCAIKGNGEKLVTLLDGVGPSRKVAELLSEATPC